ncbi:MAG: manganese efflux pump, partial [Oscillospiraceae bacterium]|nr:manganese efflux pump [Oscillospiraceae bacterium]
SPPKEESGGRYDLSVPSLAALALATSLDALAAGVSLAYLETGLLSAAGMIGAVAFALSALAGLLGRQLGGRWQRWAGLAGGLVLLGLGVKILADHVMI